MKKIFVGLIVMLCVSLFVSGEEGMWLMNQVKKLDLEKKGFEISATDIYDPGKPCIAHAVVNLGGGTASLVSANGLMVTNHHVAFGAVQRASTKGTDYITHGFLAKTLAEEIEAPGYTARIIREIKDVTHEFTRFDKIKDPEERKKAIDRKIKKITEKIEKGKKDISARVAGMYNGKQYILFVYKRFDDVRVVYVPPQGIGNFGGDIDNFMWPRHTGDFSFLRIYTAPDGTGREYHKDNVPYKPQYWLKVAEQGLKEGDLTFIMGYPGSTVRYRTSASVADNFLHNYPMRIKYYKELIDLLRTFAGDSQIAKAKVAGLDSGLNNAMKYYQGNVDGMTRTNFLQQKIDFEDRLMMFLKKDDTLYKKYGDILGKIKEQYDLQAKYRELDDIFSFMASRRSLAGVLFGTAQMAYNTAKEREKPKKLRDPQFSEKDIKRRVDRLRFRYISFYEPLDKAMLKKAMKQTETLPRELRLKDLDSLLKEKNQTIDQWVEWAYANTKLKDVAFAKSLFNKKVKELEALDEPFIQMAKRLYPEVEAYRKRGKQNQAALEELRKRYIDALYAWKGSGLYPDANGTLRFSYGQVQGYSPRDAVYYKPFTTLKGMMAKDTGKRPFDVPEGLKPLYAKKDFGRWLHPDLEQVPIAFTHKVDSTGGNSGSPVINAKGELVGILFDGNYEAMTADWQYEEAITRSISVDIRMVMFVTEKLAHAHHILEEMNIR